MKLVLIVICFFFTAINAPATKHCNAIFTSDHPTSHTKAAALQNLQKIEALAHLESPTTPDGYTKNIIHLNNHSNTVGYKDIVTEARLNIAKRIQFLKRKISKENVKIETLDLILNSSDTVFSPRPNFKNPELLSLIAYNGLLVPYLFINIHPALGTTAFLVMLTKSLDMLYRIKESKDAFVFKTDLLDEAIRFLPSNMENQEWAYMGFTMNIPSKYNDKLDMMAVERTSYEFDKWQYGAYQETQLVQAIQVKLGNLLAEKLDPNTNTSLDLFIHKKQGSKFSLQIILAYEDSAEN